MLAYAAARMFPSLSFSTNHGTQTHRIVAVPGRCLLAYHQTGCYICLPHSPSPFALLSSSFHSHPHIAITGLQSLKP